MDLEDVLGDVETDDVDPHGTAPAGSGPLYRTPMTGGGAVHPINGRLRDELLNETLFRSLPQARVVLESWRRDYNTERPHSSLGWQTPLAFAARWHGSSAQRARALSQSEGFAPWPLASSAENTQSAADSNSRWLNTGEHVKAMQLHRSAPSR